MLQMERLLVPIDFSDMSLAAVRRAAELARRFHSQITVLYVNELPEIQAIGGPMGFATASWDSVRSEYLAARKTQLDDFGVAELNGIPVRRIVCCGDPAQVIVARAAAERTHLIIMPTRGIGAFRRFLLGSVTAKVLHDADCPVWTGAHAAETPPAPAHVGHVMCAVDFGPQSVKALRWGADFAKAVSARLTVAHAVLEVPPNLPDRYAFQWHEEAHWGANERLQTLLLDSGVHAEALVVSDGDVARALSEAASEKGTGLMVIGRRCAGCAPMRLGTHGYAIVCSAPCPVVSI